MIRFKCPTCGSPFEVDDRLAGRTGRCKGCGNRTEVPAGAMAEVRSDKPATRATRAPAGFRLSPIAPEERAEPVVPAGKPIGWLDAVTSQVALAPISADNIPALRRMRSPLDEGPSEGPYKLAKAPELPALKSLGGRPAGSITVGYRHGMGRVAKLFRWLNESAYLVSVPFLMCLLLGFALRIHPFMVLGATGVVLLNIGRLLAGLANLVVIPFRESPLKGILFLIPPFTLFYLACNWNKVEKTVKRIIGPIFTIGLVFLAFVLEPWLAGKGKPKGSIEDQLRSGARSMGDALREEVGKVPGVKVEDLEKLVPRATDAIESIKNSDTIKAIESSETLKKLKEQVGEAGKRLRTPASKGDEAKNVRPGE